MELFSLIYRGKNQEKKVLTQQEESNITAVFSLLYSWKTIPGKKQDGTLDENKLTSWVNTVLTLAEKMDRTDITQHYIGSRLFYAPCDSDGFFINRSVAMMLQKNNHEEMRMGYLIEAKNARGAHIVDETGQAEFKLEKEYNEKADAAEREGFTRFARVIRLIADDYHSEGLANIEDARNRN